MKFINWRWASSQSNSLWDIIKEDQTHFASLSGVMQYAFDWPYVMHHDAKISVYQDKISTFIHIYTFMYHSTFIPNPLWNWGSLERLIHFDGGTIKVTIPSSPSQASPGPVSSAVWACQPLGENCKLFCAKLALLIRYRWVFVLLVAKTPTLKVSLIMKRRRRKRTV